MKVLAPKTNPRVPRTKRIWASPVVGEPVVNELATGAEAIAFPALAAVDRERDNAVR
jgi:hypothetical protein